MASTLVRRARNSICRCGENFSVASGLDVVAQPLALTRVRDVLDLVGDRRAVRLARFGSTSASVLPGTLTRSTRGRNRAHERRRQSVGLRFERRVADRRRAERIEMRREMSVAAVRRDDRHARGDGAQHLVGGWRRNRAGSARGRERRRDCGTGAGLQYRAIRRLFVETVAPLQQFVDAAKILARLRALNHAMIVGARHLHDLSKRPAVGAIARWRRAKPGG